MTMRAYLLPFADHLRAQGWQVDAAAEGLTADSAASAHFSQVFDLHWSRVPMSPRNWQAVNRIRSLVRDGGYDIVHVHTPGSGPDHPSVDFADHHVGRARPSARPVVRPVGILRRLARIAAF